MVKLSTMLLLGVLLIGAIIIAYSLFYAGGVAADFAYNAGNTSLPGQYEFAFTVNAAGGLALRLPEPTQASAALLPLGRGRHRRPDRGGGVLPRHLRLNISKQQPLYSALASQSYASGSHRCHFHRHHGLHSRSRVRGYRP